MFITTCQYVVDCTVDKVDNSICNNEYVVLDLARLAKSGDSIAVTPNLSVGLMTSSDCGGDDDDDGDDDAAFAGDDVTSSAAVALTDSGIPPQTVPGVAVVHLGCSEPGDGVDAVW